MLSGKKPGRKPKHYIASNGRQIEVLGYDLKSGRWRVIATNKFFRAKDEAAAIARFRELTRPGPTLKQRRRMFGGWSPADPDDMDLFGPGGVLAAPTLDADEAASLIKARLWAYVARKIREAPKWVAEQTGDERIGYLDRVRPAEPVPTLVELEKLWQSHANIAREEKRKVLAAFRDFRAVTRVAEVGDITPGVARDYRDQVHSRNLGRKTQAHRFNRIRRLTAVAAAFRDQQHPLLDSPE